VGTGVVFPLAGVAGGGDDGPVLIHDDGADGNLATLTGGLPLRQGEAHPLTVVGTRGNVTEHGG